ncbi:MAG: hypothetical protein QGH20_09190, partial [Candidatus Latescibacteria bacterium]|nr:hypothetical protein [Candidatus Latescibacterota bacterium]
EGSRMEYEPYTPEIDREKKIVVDGGRSVGLNLSHWPSNATPSELRADTSAEIVLNYLKSGQRKSYGDFAIVTNDHYDVDGAIAVWMILNPDSAEDHTDLLISAATTGDFERYTSDDALKLAIAIQKFGDKEASPVADGLRDAQDYHAEAAVAYSGVLPEIGGMLADLDGYRELWQEDFDNIKDGLGLFRNGDAIVDEHEDIELAIIDTKQRLHRIARFGSTTCDRILTRTGGEWYTLEFTYETWVIMHSRRPTPRVDLLPLAAELNEMDDPATEWTSDIVQAITPTLKCMSPSAIPWDTVQETVTSYLRTSIMIPERVWHPYPETS